MTQSGYLCLDAAKNQIFISRHVQFEENILPYSKTPQPISPPEITEQINPSLVTPLMRLTVMPPPHSGPHHDATTEQPTTSSNTQVSASSSLHSSSNSSSSSNSKPTAPTENGPEPVAQTNITTNNPQNQQPSGPNTTTSNTENSQPQINPNDTNSYTDSRHQQQIVQEQNPQPLQPQQQNVAEQNHEPPQNTHHMQTRSKNNITKKKSKTSLTVSMSASTLKEPTTITQAFKDDEKLRFAMSDEFNAQQRNHTWDLVPPEPTHNIIGCKWVFKLKHLPNGDLERYKARG